MYCKHCYKSIADGSVLCPYCGKFQNEKKPFYKQAWFIVVVIVAVLFVAMQNPDKISKAEAIAAAEIRIEFVLKAPATAQFCPVNEYLVGISQEEGIAVVSGYVDSQNGFGAMIRNKFIVELHFVDEDNTDCIYLQIGDYTSGNYIDANFEFEQ